MSVRRPMAPASSSHGCWRSDRPNDSQQAVLPGPAMKLCFREGLLLVILKIRHFPLRNVG